MMHQSILIVDDSIPLHALVKTQLGNESMRFYSAYDGADAVSSAVAHRPDLILLDVDMPRTDGFSACRYLQANPLTASIPLIFLSADSILEDKVKGLSLGATDYIVKPFKPDELRARVNAAMRFIPVTEEPKMIASASRTRRLRRATPCSSVPPAPPIAPVKMVGTGSWSPATKRTARNGRFRQLGNVPLV